MQENDGFITESNESSMLYYKKLVTNPIIFGDSKIIKLMNPQKKAVWKGVQAIQYGYTHVTLKNCEEAVFIAEKFAQLRVCWYKNGMLVNIQAAT
ncbi:hypothetical protein BK708_07905 [Bacillus thuringiensis serovar yunnanensis]|nr:hypothetical protein BK708_07905 [Bacillus thuringiensis serovar yunnanensis]